MMGTPVSTKVSTLIFDPNGPIAIFSAISSILTTGHSLAIARHLHTIFNHQSTLLIPHFPPLSFFAVQASPSWLSIPRYSPVPLFSPSAGGASRQSGRPPARQTPRTRGGRGGRRGPAP